MNDKVDINIVKYYQSCLSSYEAATGDDKYEEALKAVISLNKNGIKVCYHASICMIMEKFVVEFPTPDIIGALLRSINTYLEGVIVGKNTSRLLEKVILACQSSEICEDEIVKFQSKKFCEYMWTHYPDYLENNIGSHIVRLFFQFICGVYVKKEDKVYSPKNAVISKPMQDNYEDKLDDLINRFLMNAHIQQLITNEYMSSTLQILLVLCSIRCPAKYEGVIKHLMSIFCKIDGKIPNDEVIEIPSSFQDKYQSFFLECLILTLPKGKYWKRFSRKFCQLGREKFISAILTNSDSCGIFKSVIIRMTETDFLVGLAQQLKVSLLETPKFECGNIFLKLLVEFVNKIEFFSKTTDPHQLRFFQQAIVEIIQFLARGDQNSFSLVNLLARGLKQPQVDEDGDGKDHNKETGDKICSMSASMLMQTVLAKFNPLPNSINKMFISMEGPDIVRLAADAKASRVLDAFIKSSNVLDKIKLRFISSLSPSQLAEMACSSFGSRVLDNIWTSSNGALVDLVRSNLEEERQKLKYHKIGHFIESKFFGFMPKKFGDAKSNDASNQKNKQKQQNTNKRQPLPKASQIEPKVKKRKV